MNIGVTGTICSGKSSVTRLMGELLSADILDSDEICKQLLQKEEKGWLGLTKKWGDYFLTDSHDVDRPKLRQAIFGDEQIRKEVELILHPLVRQIIQNEAKRKLQLGEDLLVEVPLLFEVGWQDDFDWTILVCASSQICLERLVSRDGISPTDGQKVLATQMDIDEKVHLADSVIDNSGSWSETVLQINQLLNVFKRVRNK